MKLVPAAGIVGLEALREAATTELTQIMGLVRAALQARFDAAKKPDQSYVYFDVEAMFPDRVIVMQDGRYWQFGYTLDDKNVVQLAEPVEVVEEFKPVSMREAASGETQFLEAKDAEGKAWDAVLLRAGKSENKNFYPDAALRESVNLFEGVRSYVRPDTEHLKGAAPDVNKIVGWVSNARFVEGRAPDTGHVAGTFNFAAGMSALRETILDAWQRGKRDLVGLSVDLFAKTTQQGTLRRAERITKVQSVDLIVNAGAGGALVRMTEAANREEQDPMKKRMLETIKAKAPEAFAKINPETITDEELEQRYAEAIAPKAAPAAPAAPAPAEDLNRPLTLGEARMIEARNHAYTAIAGSKLPELARQRLQARFDHLASFDKKQVDDEVKSEREYLARMTESGRVQMPGLEMEVEDRSAKIAGMLDAFFDPKHKDHRSTQSFRECYIEITGDRRVTGQWANVDKARLREAVGEAFRESLDSTSWANVLGNSITRRAIADYRDAVPGTIWRPVVDVVPVNDFRTNERTRWGGYGDLPIVAEGNPYTALSSPTDEKATYAVAKRGGTEDLTLEMVKNDDVGEVRRIPIKLSRSAKRTLSKFVFDFVRTNPAIYDSVAFFHASHNNLGSAALDATSLAARRLSMLKQTELNSAERISIGPKFLVVAVDLEETAVNLFRLSTNNEKTFVQSLTLTIIPVWYWTDTNDWAIAADPMDIPGIEVGFLDGQEEPEFFVQDMPTQGSMFSNDKITYKIRHIYGGAVKEFRGWDKSVVA